ncbi:MAG: hypothetical protein ACKV0T_13930 [Planctomycetales bacterium]
MSTKTSNPQNSGRRLTGVIVGYSFVLVVGVLVALTAQFNARTSVARDSVEVAILPQQAVPVAQAALGLAAAGGGTFSGSILFDGVPPKPVLAIRKGDASVKNAEVCAAEDLYGEDMIVNPENRGVQNVFVYLAKSPGPTDKPEEETVVLDQKGCRFLPHAMLVRVGQTIMVKSDDAIPHNTRTESAANPFNQVVRANDREGIPLKYKKAERLPQRVKCDFHPWMSAYQLVLDHPYMAVTDADGKFTIPNVPAGKHTFIIWHERPGYLNKKYEVEVKAGDEKKVELKFGMDKFVGFQGPQPEEIAIRAAR